MYFISTVIGDRFLMRSDWLECYFADNFHWKFYEEEFSEYQKIYFTTQGRRIHFKTGGANNTVSKEALPWLGPTGQENFYRDCIKIFIFDKIS